MLCCSKESRLDFGNVERSATICDWMVCSPSGAFVLSDKIVDAPELCSKNFGGIVRGWEEDGWLVLADEPGFIVLEAEFGPPRVRRVNLAEKPLCRMAAIARDKRLIVPSRSSGAGYS